jgi:hypothetical protein
VGWKKHPQVQEARTIAKGFAGSKHSAVHDARRVFFNSGSYLAPGMPGAIFADDISLRILILFLLVPQAIQ